MEYCPVFSNQIHSTLTRVARGEAAMGTLLLQHCHFPRYSFINLCLVYSFFVTGNEEHFIIISIVCLEKIGFFNENQHVNIMLTHKKGKIILTSWAFVKGKASSSLVGSLATALGPQAWVELK